MSFLSTLKWMFGGPAPQVASATSAVVASKLRAAAKVAPTTPIGRAKARGWRPPAIRRGGGGGGGAYDYDDGFYDDRYHVPPPEDGDDADLQGAGAEEYYRHFDREDQLAGWTDDLAKIGVNLAKGAASGALSTVARGLTPTVAAPPPPPPGMSTTAKLAIGAAVAVPALYLLTRKRSSAPVAA